MSSLVSVVVPNYNHGRFLANRIESVLAQSYPFLEIVLLDDCSDDNSFEIIRQYLDEPRIIRVERNSVNSGSVFQQWQKGISFCKGEFVWIAESDDYSLPSFVEQMVNVLREDGSVMAVCNSVRVSADNEELGDLIITERRKLISGPEFLKSYLLYDCSIGNVSSVLFRRDCLTRVVSEVPSNLRLTGDWYTYIRMCDYGNVSLHPSMMNFFRCHLYSVRAKSIKSGLWLKEGAYLQELIVSEMNLDMSERKRLSRVVYSRYAKYFSRFSEGTSWNVLKSLKPVLTNVDYAKAFARTLYSTLLN